jgi:hypothetical protein
MTEENNPPKICNKYDGLIELIQSLESEIKFLEDQIEPKTQLVERYLKIVKDSKESFSFEAIDLKDDSKHQIVIMPMEYYSKKLHEINEELVRNDEAIKSDIEQVAKLKGKLGEVEKEISETVFVKVRYISKIGFNNETVTRWMTKEEYNENFKGHFFQKRLF